jgi:hypothetical protein
MDAAMSSAALGTATNLLSGGMAAALGVGSLTKELRATLSQYEATERKLSGLIARFSSAVATYSAATLENYQATLLGKVSVRLGTAYNEMSYLSRAGSTFAIARQAPQWVASIATSKTMLEKMPPEVRAQQEFDATALAAYNTASARLSSMNGDYIIDGVDYASNLVSAGKYLADVVERILDAAQTTEIQDNVDWLAVSSTGTPMTQISYVSAQDAGGDTLVYRMSGDTLLGGESFPDVTMRPSRVDVALVHANLVVDIMTDFNADEPPGSALITSLIGLLRLLQQDRAADMLSEAGITDFMDAAPLSWTYAGAAANCLQKAMADALAQGLDRVYDELDTDFTKFTAKVAALQRSMQRKSVFSLDSVLDRLETQMADLDKTRDQIVSLVSGLSC